MEEQYPPIKSKIELSANKTFGLILTLTVLIISGLISLNIYQSLVIADLRVRVEKVKISVFLETQELIIDKYWLGKINEYGGVLGDALLETNKALMGSLDEVSRE